MYSSTSTVPRVTFYCSASEGTESCTESLHRVIHRVMHRLLVEVEAGAKRRRPMWDGWRTNSPGGVGELVVRLRHSRRSARARVRRPPERHRPPPRCCAGGPSHYQVEHVLAGSYVVPGGSTRPAPLAALYSTARRWHATCFVCLCLLLCRIVGGAICGDLHCRSTGAYTCWGLRSVWRQSELPFVTARVFAPTRASHYRQP